MIRISNWVCKECATRSKLFAYVLIQFKGTYEMIDMFAFFAMSTIYLPYDCGCLARQTNGVSSLSLSLSLSLSFVSQLQRKEPVFTMNIRYDKGVCQSFAKFFFKKRLIQLFIVIQLSITGRADGNLNC